MPETGFRSPPRNQKRPYRAMKESPEARFERLATLRVNKVLRALRTLGNLGNPVYQPTPEMVAQMHQSIMREADQAFARISGRNLGVGFRFKQ